MAMLVPQQHQALVQTAYAQPLEVKTVPTPQVASGSALVKTLYTPIVSYTKEVVYGIRKYLYPTPFVFGPSGVGRVVALGPDSTSLELGQLVYVDSVIRSRNDPSDISKLQRDVWRNGTSADYVSVPLENVFPLNEEVLIHKLGYRLQELAMMSRFLVPYGGLVDINLRVGETIIVTPATGAFSGAAVALAVAMGATVIAMGRNESALLELTKGFGDRVKTVQITNDVAIDTQALKDVASGPIDAVLELSPPAAAKSTHIESAVLALRHGGRVSLMGGITENYSMPIRTIMRKDIMLKGKWMYERVDILSFIRLVESGVLNIGAKGGLSIVGEYKLSDWEEALDKASQEARWDASVIFKLGEADVS
ncbi:hypothetical protein N0V83_001608 [Neocucurbitaria cava]|uniref:Alcohol dehydrogenase n=1 Tax=Neocucurbitaria cava TaxID=798079 RepID=A0A9W8YG10_9PLEO|nr:hypothetical protein N0V83_001608 [Neocucurbitaria cava]